MTMQKKFKFLPHTADAKFIAYGKNLEEAFSNAALATFSIITDIAKIKPKFERNIAITSKKKESLLYDFLEQLIFLIDTEGFLLSKVKKLDISKKDNTFKLNADLLGDNADNYEVYGAIKAVTYNDMFIKEEKDLVKIQVVHDI